MGKNTKPFPQKCSCWNHILISSFVICCTVSGLPGKNVPLEDCSISLISQGRLHMGIFHVFLTDGIYCCGVFKNSLRWKWMTASSFQTVRRTKFNTLIVSGWELSYFFCCWNFVYLISTMQPSLGPSHDIFCIVLLCPKVKPINEFWFKGLLIGHLILVSRSPWYQKLILRLTCIISIILILQW